MALLGYARVSKIDQNVGLQLEALRQAGCEHIFEEKASGAQRDRPVLTKAIEFARAGDTLCIWKLDRLGRSLKQLIDTVELLGERGVGVRSLTEGIDSSTSGGKVIFAVCGALAEAERQILRERTLAGLENARRLGRKGGRPRSMSADDMAAARAMLMSPDITVEAVAERIGVSPATLYRYFPGGRQAL